MARKNANPEETDVKSLRLDSPDPIRAIVAATVQQTSSARWRKPSRRATRWACVGFAEGSGARFFEPLVGKLESTPLLHRREQREAEIGPQPARTSFT